MPRLGKIGLVIIGLLIVVALSAPVFIPKERTESQSLMHRLERPSRVNLLGRDENGRDVFARLVYGTRISLRVAVLVTLISAVIGIIIGSFSGFYGGWVDRIMSGFLFNVIMAFPGILLAIAMVAFLGPSITNLIIALCVIGWVGYARLMRGQVLKVREYDYVIAARALGAGSLRILLRHILPNAIQPLIVQASLGMAGAVLAEASLSFLGLGVPEPTPSWGKMLNDGRAFLFNAPHLIIFPGIMIMITVMAFNFVGDGLREWLDPKQQRR